MDLDILSVFICETWPSIPVVRVTYYLSIVNTKL